MTTTLSSSASPTKPYYTFNPACLDDESDITYRELQKLCKSLGIKASGKRLVLIQRLKTWYYKTNAYEITTPEDKNKENGEPNSPISPYIGNNKFKKNKAGVVVFSPNSQTPIVNQRYLSPLVRQPRKNADGTPISIMSPHVRSTKKKKKKNNGIDRHIEFSVINGVKQIPTRHESNYPKNCLDDLSYFKGEDYTNLNYTGLEDKDNEDDEDDDDDDLGGIDLSCHEDDNDEQEEEDFDEYFHDDEISFAKQT